MSTCSIIIPVRGSSNTVEIFNDELPEDPADVIDLLRAELAPLDTWCEFAVAYHRQGRHAQFREILHGVVDAFDVYEMQDFYRREPSLFLRGRLRILNLLAASATNSFIDEELRKDSREAWRQKALEYIGRADKISTNCPQTWLVKALFWIGEHNHDENALRNAAYYADSSLRSNGGSSCNSKLAKAAILFHETSYADSLKLYVSALRSDPKAAGASARVGVGLCAYHLGDKSKAMAAFERALALSPTNVEALVAIALLRLEFSFTKAGITKAAMGGANLLAATLPTQHDVDVAAHMLGRATELVPTHSNALNHFANYLFWNWKKVPFTARVVPGNMSISCSADPTQYLRSGVSIKLGCAGNGTFQAKILDDLPQMTSPNRWTMKVAPSNIFCLGVEHEEMPVYVKNIPEVDNLASRAYHCTVVPEIQAEAYFILGRNSHAHGNVDDALPYYTQACKIWPRFALAQFRLAQVRAATGDLVPATEAAETAFELAPHVPEVLRLLGLLRLELDLDDAARQVLHLAVKANKDDHFAWLALAVAEERSSFKLRGTEYEVSSVEMAISAYKIADELGNKRGFDVPHQVSNNMGVLQLQRGNSRSATKIILAALCTGEQEHGLDDQRREREITSSSSGSGPLGTAESENAPLWCWDRVICEGVKVDKHDAHNLWSNTPIVPPLSVGERIKIGNNDLNVIISGVKKNASNASKQGLGEEHEQIALLPGKFLIELSEPIRHAIDSSMRQPLYRLQPPNYRSWPVSLAPTMCVNLAQLHAAAGTFTAARELAEIALTMIPNSMRALLLLARTSLGANKINQAQVYVDRAIDCVSAVSAATEGDANHFECIADALAVASAVQWELKDDNLTLGILQRLRSICTKSRDKEDSYTNVTLGKLYFDGMLTKNGADTGACTASRAQQLKHAADHARLVLRHTPSCAAAAHILGLVLLEQGQLDDAAIVFERIREDALGSGLSSTSGAPNTSMKTTSQEIALLSALVWDSTVNLAHSRLLQGRMTEAAAGYLACAKSSPVELTGAYVRGTAIQSSRADLDHWRARALHGAGEASGATRAIASAIHMRPDHQLLRWHCAVIVLERASSESTKANLSRNKSGSIVDELCFSRKIFDWFAINNELNDLFKLPLLVLPEEFVARCDAILNEAPAIVAHACELHATSGRLRDAQLEQLARIVAERRSREAAATTAADVVATKLRVKAKKKEEELCKLQEKWSSVSSIDAGSGGIGQDDSVGDVDIAAYRDFPENDLSKR